MGHNKKSVILIVLLLTILSLSLPVYAGISMRTVKGTIKNDAGTLINNATVTVRTSIEINSTYSCNCSTPTSPSYSYTENGGFTISSGNLIFDFACSQLGDPVYDTCAGCSCDSYQGSNDKLWIFVDGSTSDTPMGNFTSIIAAGYTWSYYYVMAEFADIINATITGTPPIITNVTPPTGSWFNHSIIPFNVTTDLNSTCKFDTSSGIYDSKAYTMDGNTTFHNSTITLTSEGGNTFYIQCRNVGGTSSEYVYTLNRDTTPPTTTNNYAYNNTWRNSAANIGLFCSDTGIGCNKTYFCFDSSNSCSPSNQYNGSAINIVAEGTTYLRYYSIDSLGNIENVSYIIIKLDFTPPSSIDAFEIINNNDTYSTSTTLNNTWGNFSDNLSGIKTYHYAFTNGGGTGGGLTKNESPGVINGATQGLIYVYVWAEDYAGNYGSSVYDTIIVDSVPPAVSVQNIIEDYSGQFLYYNSGLGVLFYSDLGDANFTIRVAASDQTSGLQKAEGSTFFGDSPIDYTNISGPYQYELSYSIETNTSSGGIITITAYDNVNWTNTTTLNVTLDTAPPQATTVTDNFVGWNPNNNVTFNWNASVDLLSGTQSYLWNIDNGTNYTTTNLSAIAQNLSDGNHTFYLYAVDNVGNLGLVGTHELSVDATPPLPPVTVLDEGVYNNTGNFNLWWTASNDTSGILNYDLYQSDSGGAYTLINSSISGLTILLTGRADTHNYTYKVVARNGAGLTSEMSNASDGILVDLVPPAISVQNVVEVDGTDYTYYSGGILYYSDIGPSNFSVRIAASDATSGLNNGSGAVYFGESPYSDTPLAGAYQFEFNYSKEVPSPPSSLLNFTAYDRAGNHNYTSLQVIRDVNPPGATTPTDGFTGWNSNPNVTFTWPASSEVSGVQYYLWNIDNGTNYTTTNLSATALNLADGNHTFYLYAMDNVGNFGFVGSHDLSVDSTPPAAPISIWDDGVYSITGNITVYWTQVNDTSGITGYDLYENDNNAGFVLAQSGITSLSYTRTGRTHTHNYTYEVRARNGAGIYSNLSNPTDGEYVDLVPPAFTNWEWNAIYSNTTGVNLTVNVTVTDSGSGVSGMPQFRYHIGADIWSSYENLTLISGSNYQFTITEPVGGWVTRKGETIYWETAASDIAGNNGTGSNSTTIVSINKIYFDVVDRLLSEPLANITVTGGTTCALGCLFDYNITLYENNGNYTFTFTKAGFSTNITQLNVNTADYNITIRLDDIEDPNISGVEFLPRIDNNSFYVEVYMNVTENFRMQNVSFSYTFSKGLNDTGVILLTNMSDILYHVSLGPYNTSFLMESSETAEDYYGNKDLENNPAVWFIFANGNVSTIQGLTLDPIGTQILFVGQPYNHTATYQNAAGPVVFSDDTSLFNIDSSTGLINFTPYTPGDYYVNISITDGVSTDYEIVLFKVVTLCGVLNFPYFTSPVPDQYKEFNPASWAINLTSYAADNETSQENLQWAVSGVDPIMFLVNITGGMMTFNANHGRSGYDRITLTVRDETNLTATQDFTIRVNRTIYLYKGWNLISVTQLENTSIMDILPMLGNGNFGCGHDDVPPFDCIEIDGDYVGNWTQIMTINESSGRWHVFNPSDYYRAIPLQELQDMYVDDGYWIYMNESMNLTLKS